MSALNTPIDLIGHQYGRLTVRERIDVTPSGARWRCICTCGGEVIRLTANLRRKNFSGGCKGCEPSVRAAVHVTHAGALGGRSRLYRIWKGMRTRCSNPNEAGWKYYGGKGVRVCVEWEDFAMFKKWALANGYRDDLTIERLESSGHYEPDNCEWITRSENSRRAQTQVHA